MGKPAEVDALDADRLLRSLVERKVEFVVIGGLAVAAHGYIRATKDVDIVPDPGQRNLERLYSTLQSIDAEPLEAADFRREELPVGFDLDGLLHGGNWALRTVHGRLDLMQFVPGMESYGQLRAGALLIDVPEVGSIAFAGYDDLVAMKTAAGRPEDEQDLARLREARSS